MIGYGFYLNLSAMDLSIVCLAIGLGIYAKGTRVGLHRFDMKLRVDFTIKLEFQQQRVEPVIEKRQLVISVSLNIIDLFDEIELRLHIVSKSAKPRVFQRLLKSSASGLNVCICRVLKKLVTAGLSKQRFLRSFAFASQRELK